MKNRGLAHMGIGEGKGEKRNEIAVRQAIASPLLETSINGAKAVIINVKGGFDLTLEEVNDAVNLVKEVVSPDANTIFGATIDENYNDRMIVTIVATGFEGSKFENATTSLQKNGLFNNNNNMQTSNSLNDRLSQISKPQNTGNFDKSRFNDFVTGKPAVSSLFERGYDPQNQMVRPSNNMSQGYDRSQSQQQRQDNSDVDLWNRLSKTSTQNNPYNKPQNGLYEENDLDKKYGLNENSQNARPVQNNQYGGQMGVSTPASSGSQNLHNQSSVRVEDADIPPFLRRKFNK